MKKNIILVRVIVKTKILKLFQQNGIQKYMQN